MPTVLLENQFRWTGSVPLEEIVDVIITRNPNSLGASSLERLLKDGNAAQLADMMTGSQQIFPAFYDLLTHNKWPVRLGAMVVAETIAAQNTELAAELLMPLWQRFEAVSDQIKGDLLYVFGAIGHPTAVPWLQSVLNGGYDAEVKEAAREALDTSAS